MNTVTVVGRLAVVDGWGGLYGLAVDPAARRRGHATAVMRTLFQRARRLGVRRIWLQVSASNRPALTLYQRLGFTTVTTYHYRTAGS